MQHGPLHRVQTLDDDQDLLPRSVRSWLTLTDAFPQQRVERLHIVVLERPDRGTRQPDPESDGRVVEFV